jgi:hypothetical protein
MEYISLLIILLMACASDELASCLVDLKVTIDSFYQIEPYTKAASELKLIGSVILCGANFLFA